MTMTDATIAVDLDLERELLGAMLMSGGIIDALADGLAAGDFYRTAHQQFFDAAVALEQRGIRADVVSTAEELRRREQLDQPAYFAKLTDGMARRDADGRHYLVRRVRELAMARRIDALLAGARPRLATGRDIADQAIEIIAEIEAVRSGWAADARVLDSFRQAQAMLEDLTRDPGEAVRWGFPGLDDQIPGVYPGEVFGLMARPGVGKTLMLTHLTKHLAPLGHVFFSLEMPAAQIAGRLARAAYGMTRHQLQEAARRGLDIGPYLEAATGLQVIDQAGLSVAQMDGHLRALKSGAMRETPIRLVTVDHLGLIGGDRTMSTYDRVSTQARELKDLAKRHNVAVVVAIQVNREQGGDGSRELTLGSARDSVTGETPIALADGSWVPISQLVGQANVRLLSVDTQWHPMHATARRFWLKGRRQVFRVTTRTGRTIRVTAEHPFLTAEAGWLALSGLAVGRRIAVPIGWATNGHKTVTEDEALLLGLLTGDGALTKRPHTYTDGNASIRAIVAELARRLGVIAKPKPGEVETLVLSTPPGHVNPINDLVGRSGLFGVKSPARRVPELILRGTPKIVSAYVRGLWSTDGCATDREVKYATASRGLADDMQMLCARLGIHTMLMTTTYSKGGYSGSQGRPYWVVTVRRTRDIHLFAEVVGLLGTKYLRLLNTLLLHPTVARDRMVDLVPRELWPSLHAARRVRGLQWLEAFGKRSGVDERRDIGRERFVEIAQRIGDADLLEIAHAPVVFDEIMSIESDGEADVFDAEVPGRANFMAAGFWVHNSGVVEEAMDYLVALRRLDYSRDLAQEARDKYRDVLFAKVLKNRHGTLGRDELAIRLNGYDLTLAEDPNLKPEDVDLRDLLARQRGGRR